jgi:putative colanic acid biosynthesis UDP-glucose lipid carrier transferase
MEEPIQQTRVLPRVRSREANGQTSVLAWDVLAILASHALCFRLHMHIWFGHDTVAAGVGAVAYYLVASTRGLDRGAASEPLSHSFQRVWACWAYVIPVLLALGFWTKTLESYSRVINLTWFVAAPLSSTLLRMLQRASRQARVLGYPIRRAAVYGGSELGTELVSNMLGATGFGMGFAGIYDDRHISRLTASPERTQGNRASQPSVNVVGDLEKLVEAARSGVVDVVYIALPLRAERRINTIIRRLQDTTASVYMACDFSALCAQSSWQQVGEIPVMQVGGRAEQRSPELVKRLEDVVLSGLLIGVLALPMTIIALAIKLRSRGPVFTRKRRFGLHGDEVHLLSFRTAELTADSIDRASSAAQLNFCGGWLLRTGLDELPALIQVFLGNLSLVGPQPHRLEQSSEYRALVEAHGFHRKIKPGITSLARVEHQGSPDGAAGEDLKKRVEYDLAYARDWALIRDLDIIFRTAHTFVKPRRGGGA